MAFLTKIEGTVAGWVKLKIPKVPRLISAQYLALMFSDFFIVKFPSLFLYLIVPLVCCSQVQLEGRYAYTMEESVGTSELGNVCKKPFNVDIEQRLDDQCHLLNETVRNYVWQGVTVVAKDRKTKQPKTILQNVAGIVEAGELCALMGPRSVAHYQI